MMGFICVNISSELRHFFQLIGCKSEFYCSFVSSGLGGFLWRQFFSIWKEGEHNERQRKIPISPFEWFCQKLKPITLNKWPLNLKVLEGIQNSGQVFYVLTYFDSEATDFSYIFQLGSLHTTLSILYPQSCIFHSSKTIHKYGIIQSFIFNTISKTKKKFPKNFVLSLLFAPFNTSIRNRFNQIPIKLNLLNVCPSNFMDFH